MDNYEIIIGSPIEYNELVAFIYINDKPVALLNQDLGPGNLVVEFFKDADLSKISYDLLVRSLIAAKEKLIK